MEKRSLQSLSDEELLYLCKEGSHELGSRCISIVIKRYQAPLLGYITRIVGDRNRAEDVMQSAFISLFKHRKEYKGIAKVSTWLYKIATNYALNALRDSGRKREISLQRPVAGEGDVETELGAFLPAVTKTPAELMRDEELARFIHSAIHQLPEKYMIVAVLCDVQGFSYKEAAEILDLPLSTIGSRLLRARAFLSQIFEPYFDCLKR